MPKGVIEVEFDPKGGVTKYKFCGVEITEEEAQPLFVAMGKTKEAQANEREIQTKLAEKLEKEGRVKWKR